MAFSRRFRSRTWLAVVVVVVALVVALLAIAVSTTTGRHERTEEMTAEELEAEKLREEIRTLEQDRNPIFNLGPLVAAIGAASGALATWWKQVNENARQRNEDRHLREAAAREDTRQRELRMKEDFASVATNLGGERPPLQASAAVSLLSFLDEDAAEFHRQVLLLVVANLKVEHEREVNKLLVRVFERAVRLQLESETVDRRLVLDLVDADLDTVDLSGLDLSEVDVAFASLRYANLRETKLFRARGYEVDLEKALLSDAQLEEARLEKAHCPDAYFHEAVLVSAHLKEADLTNADFRGAKLQQANLEGAVLDGAVFEEADLNDTRFLGARLTDDATVHSLSRAYNWREAAFDPEVASRVAAASGSGADGGE